MFKPSEKDLFEYTVFKSACRWRRILSLVTGISELLWNVVCFTDSLIFKAVFPRSVQRNLFLVVESVLHVRPADIKASWERFRSISATPGGRHFISSVFKVCFVCIVGATVWHGWPATTQQPADGHTEIPGKKHAYYTSFNISLWYCIQTLARHSCIHYTDCWIVK